jgi:hypothetical protein
MGADHIERETLESGLAFGGAALADIIDDPDRAFEVARAVRRRDAERFDIQLAGGSSFPTPYGPLPAIPARTFDQSAAQAARIG